MELRPGEVYVEGDPLIFSSWQAREIFYHYPNLVDFPIAFDSLEAADRACHPERYDGNQTPPGEEAMIDLAGPDTFRLAVVREPDEIEVLQPPVQTFDSPPENFYGIQVAGGIHNYYYKEQPARDEQPAPQHKRGETRSQISPAPKPMDMAERLVQMERFAIFERSLYIYDRAKGIYSLIDRDDTQGIIINRLAEDLRVRGTASQVRDIYEFLRLDKRLEVAGRPPKHLLAFTNGVLDLKTGEFTLGHSPDVFLTWRLEIPFMPEKKDCPRFQAVLQHISGGNPIFIARVLEAMAYLLIPAAFTKGIILFQGLSGTGKSVIGRLIGRFLDSSIVSRVAVNQFDQRFPASTLQGRCLNISMDLPGGKIGANAVALLKQVTGGDEVFVESKGVDGHSAHLDCRFLFGTNHAFAPTIRDEAFMDRIILVPFRYPIPPAEVDPEIDNKLLPERAAIFNLLLEAFYRLQRNHYQFTGEDIYGIRVAGLGDSEADPMLTAFIRERCCLDSNAKITSSELFEAYGRFLADRGLPCTENTQQFSRKFNIATPPSVYPKKVRINGPSTNCYVGIRLKGEHHEK